MIARDRRRGGRAVPAALALAALALLCAAALLASPASAADKGSRTHALIVKQAHSPVLGALKHRLDRKLDLDRTPPRGDKRSKHDLLIVDGDALSARRMARRRELRQFSNSGRWVLALDVGSKHHHRALAKHTGFEALAQGKHKSRAFLFRHAVVDGVPREIMLDSERLIPTGSEDVAKKQRRKSKRREAKRVASLIAERVRADDDELAGIAGVEEGAPAESGVPPEAIKVGYTYEAVKLNHHPKDGHYDSDHGYQVTSGVMNHSFTVYLDNSTQRPQGNFQVVTYDLNGTFAPAQDRQHFWRMDQETNFGVGIKWVMERGWWTGQIGSSVQPADTATSDKLSPQASKPETENGQTRVSSEDEFSVGFSSEGDATLSYRVDHGKSTEISDWGVTNETSGNNAKWTYSAQNPCKPRTFSGDAPPEDVQRCFNYGFGKTGGPLEPNALSLGAIGVDTSARWNTKTLLTPGNDTLRFTVNTPVTLYDSACTNTLLTRCIKYEIDQESVDPGPVTYAFNAGDALPVPVKSLQLDPTKVTTKNQDVTGTVTLERPAPADTTVTVFSNKQNAYLGTPVSGERSRAEVEIAKGATQGKFTVKTNFNGLDPGDSVTANISAFYAKSYPPVQLNIERPEGS